MTNDIYLYENKIIDGDLASYIITEGNKRDVIMPDIKEPYNIAKEKVKELTQPKITSLAKNLSEKLSKEIERIDKHFIKEIQELKNNLKKSAKKTEKEINEELEKKINEFEKDKERAINIEKQKHSLNLNTKLFNTTLIYYPVLNYDCYLINEHGKRIIEVSFDPLTKELKQIFCESCENKIEIINLCSSGHIICNKCLIKCNSCNITYCNKCLNIICESCKKKICKKCAIRCNNCSKVMCKDHAIDDKCIGFTSFSQDKKDNEALFISNLQIKKEYQNIGYGSQVLKVIEEKAKKLNYKKIKLYVFEDNPSQSLYKKFGYKQIDYLKESDTNVIQKLI